MMLPRRAENPNQITPTLAPDGLLVDEVGPWALEKYRRLALYDTLFASGMKRRWDVRVYLDLFCGPGRASIRRTGQLVETSPLIALGVRPCASTPTSFATKGRTRSPPCERAWPAISLRQTRHISSVTVTRISTRSLPQSLRCSDPIT